MRRFFSAFSGFVKMDFTSCAASGVSEITFSAMSVSVVICLVEANGARRACQTAASVFLPQRCPDFFKRISQWRQQSFHLIDERIRIGNAKRLDQRQRLQAG